MFVSGGYSGFTYFGDIHVFDLARQRWIASSGEIMKPRYAHSLTAANGSLFAFGGARERLYYRHFQVLPTDPGAYSTVPTPAALTAESAMAPAGDSGFGALAIKQGPSERAAHAVAVCEGVLYCFGGDAGKGVYFNDVHAFNPRSRSWSMVHTTGTPPSPRGWCSLSAVARKLYLLFGTNGNDVFNDVFCFDTETSTWTKIATKGADPLGRHSHSACVRGDSVYVFGGVGERKRQLLGDINIFHTPTSRWITATIAPGSPHLDARYGHTACFYGREMLIFGGCLLDQIGTRSYSNEILALTFEMRPYLRSLQCTLVADLGSLVNNQAFFSDVTFIVEGRKIYAHRAILAVRNEDFFRAMLMGPLRESTESTITIPDMSYSVFLALLEYIYTGRVSAFRQTEGAAAASATAAAGARPVPAAALPPVPGPTTVPEPMSPHTAAVQSATQLAADLLEAAHMYNMAPLERICCQRLVAGITPETVATIWQLSIIYGIRSLRLVCTHFARSNIDPKQLPSLLTDLPPDQADQFLADVRMSKK